MEVIMPEADLEEEANDVLLAAERDEAEGEFAQFFVMTGIFFLSMKSLGQKYQTMSCPEENSNLREERDALSSAWIPSSPTFTRGCLASLPPLLPPPSPLPRPLLSSKH
ncbi:hypothetical protein HPP92_013962 [Vanilla planifolia]|uniref:Uncharacterized protein n=1 Tax=Vanilla planifolia TaxID=51239 RepID=A0A835QJ54_VANPL|nr:hypothetical protein HPP92_013962 [Vanilla planifolia]